AQDGLRDAAAPLPAIVGFDDIPQADWQPYQLTTVQQNTALLAINGGASGVAIKLYEHDRSTAVSLGKTSAKQTVTPGTSGG
ncbi:hypothetical protein QUH25_28875, partial [Klebsiella pneumoniae]|nr:hypothetical protein [Klebsiella pneumoniae]